MGWKGTIRSVSAAMRAAERESERRRKAEFKAQQVEYAEDAVAEWRSLLRTIVSIHTNKADDIDWQSIASVEEPKPPQEVTKRQDIARSKIDEFKPRKLDILSGGTARRLARLEADFQDAVTLDEKETAEKQAEYDAELEEWKIDRDLAQRVLNREATAFKEVMSELYAEDESLIARSLDIRFRESDVHAIVRVADHDKVVPDFRRKQLQSGKLSETKMPKGEYFELYQDYVCSVALRLAGDIFGVLPVEDCHVTCEAKLLDSKTGHLSETPILSVFFVRQTFNFLNLDAIDPSDSMANFKHAMSFKRTKGLDRIEPLAPIDP